MPIRKPTDEDYLDDPDDQQDQLKEEEGDDESGVGLLSKSILRGKSASVGDKVTLEITAIHDDQIAVKYPGEETPDETKEETPETPAEDEAALAEVEPPPAPDENYD